MSAKPPPRVAEVLVVVLSRGSSLELYADIGLFDREWALYRRLLKAEEGPRHVVLVTYGGTRDRELAPRLGEHATLICNDGGLPLRDYLESVPDLVTKAVGGAPRVLVKIDQMVGGDLAIAVTASLRQAGKSVGFVARGGYLASQFVAWEQGSDSAYAINTAEEEGRLCKAADMVVGTTRQMVDDLCWRHNLIEARTAVIPNYVITLEEPLGEDRVRGTILFAGRLVPQKRVDRIIEAVSELRQDLKDRVTVQIVGSGPLQEQLREMAANLGVRAVFESRLPQSELIERMRKCQIYAQTSGFEGHPKTVIEAMSLGAPVLVCDVPGMRGVVRHGVTGLCVPPEIEAIRTALEGLLDDPEWGDSLGLQAAAFARGAFAVERIVEQELTVYRRAMEVGSHAAATSTWQTINVNSAVRWEPSLPDARLEEQTNAWSRSLRGFLRRLSPKDRQRFLLAMSGPIEQMQQSGVVDSAVA